MITSLLEEPAAVEPKGLLERWRQNHYPYGDSESPPPPLPASAENQDLCMVWTGRGRRSSDKWMTGEVDTSQTYLLIQTLFL